MPSDQPPKVKPLLVIPVAAASWKVWPIVLVPCVGKVPVVALFNE